MTIEFSNAVSWLSFTPDQAEAFAVTLVHFARETKTKMGMAAEPVSSAQKIAAGLALIADYEDAEVDAQHDVLYAKAAGISTADQAQLLRLGWRWSKNAEAWEHFT